MSDVEQEEKARLAACKRSIQGAIADIQQRLDAYQDEIKSRKTYLWEARRDMDHIEKIAVRQTIEQTLDSAEILQQQQLKLRKLLQSPYFGRFDFQRAEQAAEPIYIGVNHYRDEAARETLVYDWRAPIASLFYDYETGPAEYQAPDGRVQGQIVAKRQYRIRDGELQFMLDSAVNIVDDMLQEELSRSAGDEGMQQIVATIQRDQNAIIRDDDTHTLIIQGVAGSGKTSIALHRIAFLLYRFKDSLTADDILIISPNRVFADYIGNVLPELGEEPVMEMGMDALAAELLDHEYRFQSFFEQATALLEGKDDSLPARIAAKSGVDFLQHLDAYASHLEADSFAPNDWRSGRKIVPGWFLAESWARHAGQPLTERVARVLSEAEQKIGFYYNYDLQIEERRSLREAIRGMSRNLSLRDAYQQMFDWLEQPELFKLSRGRLEYADVFPLIYLKMRLQGVNNPRAGVKHLLIDEMQDYSPLQYTVLARLFSCRKTVLGDASQALNPHGSSSAAEIQRAFQTALCVKLTKSYRSTWQIMQLALSIAPNSELEPMRRDGRMPEVNNFDRPQQAQQQLLKLIADYQASAYRSLALITKTQRQAKQLHRSLTAAGIELRLLDEYSSGFSAGILVCTAYLAKGLEFDRVIVCHVNADTYASEMDRNLLYVACTRAMHELDLVGAGAPSPLLADWSPAA